MGSEQLRVTGLREERNPDRPATTEFQCKHGPPEERAADDPNDLADIRTLRPPNRMERDAILAYRDATEKRSARERHVHRRQSELSKCNERSSRLLHS
ncbi:MAG: hypothetical protein M3256_16625 [Actinomycetota bacterium]|nr:hypothetical protein [Actinomycetota bacterium]